MFGKNLKYYRLKRDMTKKKLAEACGITPMALTYYEQEKRQPKMETVKKMAEVLKVNIADFVAFRNSALKFTHNEFRKTNGLTKSQQEYIREAVEEYFSRFFNAVECVGDRALPIPPECHCLKSADDQEKDAVKLRKHLGISEDGPVNELIAVLENKGILVLRMEVNNEHFSGMNGFVDEYPYIVINETMKPAVQRSTIAHELTHMMFKDIDDSKEKYAMAVGGAFLIGKKDLVRELGLKRTIIAKDMLLVCREYGVSMGLLVQRAKQVGIISEPLAKNYYIFANKHGLRRNDPAEIKDEEPMLFKQLVYRAINEEGISFQKGAELLKLPYDAVVSECQTWEA